MAQAHRLAGRRGEALGLYRKYLAAAPRGDLVAEAKQWITDIENAMARETKAAEAMRARREAEERARREAEERARREAEERAREEEARRPAEPAPQVEVVAPAPRPPERSAGRERDRARGWRIAGIVTAGAGAATIAGGGLFGLRAKSISDDLSEHNALYDRDKVDEGKTAERMMFVLYGVGGALLVGGVVAYVLNRQVDEQSTGISLTMEPSGAAFTVGGRF